MPNATVILVLGILSIATIYLFSIATALFGIIALILARKDTLLYKANFELYSKKSFKKLNIGKVLALINIIICVVGIILYVVLGLIFGFIIDMFQIFGFH